MKKTIETKTQSWTHTENESHVDVPVPPGTPVTVSYDAPEVEIQPGQRWRDEQGRVWLVAKKPNSQSVWLAVANEGFPITLEGTIIPSKKTLERWLNNNAVLIEEDGKT